MIVSKEQILDMPAVLELIKEEKIKNKKVKIAVAK